MQRAPQDALLINDFPVLNAHREAVIAVDAAAPTAEQFAENSGRAACARAYCVWDEKGDPTSACTVRVWVMRGRDLTRTPDYVGGVLYVDNGAGLPAPYEVTSAGGDESFVIDIPVDADDVFVQLVSASGAPASFRFDCWIRWGP